MTKLKLLSSQLQALKKLSNNIGKTFLCCLLKAMKVGIRLINTMPITSGNFIIRIKKRGWENERGNGWGYYKTLNSLLSQVYTPMGGKGWENGVEKEKKIKKKERKEKKGEKEKKRGSLYLYI